MSRRQGNRVATAVNIAEVYTKFHIGQYIVEYEQKGETRAEYGKAVLKELSKRLTDRLGDGWSYSNVCAKSDSFILVYGKLTNHWLSNLRMSKRLTSG